MLVELHRAHYIRADWVRRVAPTQPENDGEWCVSIIVSPPPGYGGPDVHRIPCTDYHDAALSADHFVRRCNEILKSA